MKKHILKYARSHLGAGTQSKNSYTSHKLIFLLTLLLWAVLFLVSLSIGRYSVPFFDVIHILLAQITDIPVTWDKLSAATVLTLRLPRTVASSIVGAALALSGASYQSIFKNPMVSPDLLGVSSGACIGAAVAILMNAGSSMTQFCAFLGGIIAVSITVMIPRLIRSQSTTVLVLSGVVVSSLMSSIMNLIKSIADTDTQLAEITYWSMGSFASVKFEEMLPILPSIVLPVCVILLMRFRLNVLSLGDNEARSLGVDLQKTRGVFILCSTLITASCVCLAGTIGWVGLVIPHTARMLVGSDNKHMLPVAMTLGGAFMLVIDILCRTLSAAELKIGILTGIVGAPFFIFILAKQHRSIQ